MTSPAADPKMRVRRDGDDATVAPEGELDVAVAPHLRALLHSLADEGKNVVVDLSGTTFVDSTTIGVFIGAQRRLDAVGRSLRLRSPLPPVRRVFELVGIADQSLD